MPEVLWERHDFCVVGRVLAPRRRFCGFLRGVFVVFETTVPIYIYICMSGKKSQHCNTVHVDPESPGKHRKWASASYKQGYNSIHRGYDPGNPFVRPFKFIGVLSLELVGASLVK